MCRYTLSLLDGLRRETDRQIDGELKANFRLSTCLFCPQVNQCLWLQLGELTALLIAHSGFAK